MTDCSKCGQDTGRSIIHLFGKGPLCADCAFDRISVAYDNSVKSKRKILSQMQNTIHPNEQLSEGTQVTVIGKGKGTVVKAEQTLDQHRQPIVVHHIKYGNGKVKPCNYSFIVRP